MEIDINNMSTEDKISLLQELLLKTNDEEYSVLVAFNDKDEDINTMYTLIHNYKIMISESGINNLTDDIKNEAIEKYNNDLDRFLIMFPEIIKSNTNLL